MCVCVRACISQSDYRRCGPKKKNLDRMCDIRAGEHPSTNAPYLMTEKKNLALVLTPLTLLAYCHSLAATYSLSPFTAQASKRSAVNHSLTLIGGTTKVKELLDFLLPATPATPATPAAATPQGDSPQALAHRAEFVQEARSLVMPALAIPAAMVGDTSATPPQAHRSTSYRAEFVQEARSLVMKSGGFLEMCCGKIEQGARQVLNLLAVLVQKYTY